MYAFPINPPKLLTPREERREEQHPLHVHSPHAPPPIHVHLKHQCSTSPPGSGRLSARPVSPVSPEGGSSSFGRRPSSRLGPCDMLQPDELLPVQGSNLTPHYSAALVTGTEKGPAEVATTIASAGQVDATAMAEESSGAMQPQCQQR